MAAAALQAVAPRADVDTMADRGLLDFLSFPRSGGAAEARPRPSGPAGDDGVLGGVARPILLGALVLIAGLVVAHVANRFRLGVTLFNLNEEDSFGTWVGTTLYSFTAGGALLVGWRDRERTAWWLVAAAALLLSVDDVTQLHERVERVIGAYQSVMAAWLVVLLGGGGVALRLVRRLPWRCKALLVAAGAVLVASQVAPVVGATGVTGLMFDALVLVEEGGELLAAALLFTAVAPHAVDAARDALR